MRPTIYIASFLLAAAPAVPAAAQSTPAKTDTTPPSPGTVCAEREGRCDIGAVKGERCAPGAATPCADSSSVRTACIDRDRDGKCDTHPRNRRAGFFAAIGGALTSLWVHTVPSEKGGGGGSDKDSPTTIRP